MKKTLIALAALASLASSLSANAVPFSFGCITNNSAADCQTGENQFVLDVQDIGLGTTFTFSNSGPLASSITDIYFDWTSGSALLPFPSIFEGPGVDYSWGASPNNVPGGNAIGFSADLSADSDSPTQHNGVNPGEYITFAFFGSFSEILADLLSGDLRVALHAQGFTGGGSEAFVNTPVPVPGTLALFGLAMAGIGFARRKR